jgi:hypothetical protein
MAVDEMLTALRRELERNYGVEAASYLMDRPRGGWDTLVTSDELDLKLDALRSELRGELAGGLADLRTEMAVLRADLAQELNRQTWRLATLVVAAQGIAVGALAAIRFS